MPNLPATAPIQMSEAEVLTSIRSFPAGSSAGPDGMRPQHILELVGQLDSGPGLLSAITALVNLLLCGSCPTEIRATLFGGTLFALCKHGRHEANSYRLLLAQIGQSGGIPSPETGGGGSSRRMGSSRTRRQTLLR